jgi:PLP dependent protein
MLLSNLQHRSNLGAVNIIANYQRIRAQIPEHVKLIAVSKGQDIAKIKELSLYHSDFGENYLQELEAKHKELPGIVWHYLGRIQSNKIERLLQVADVIHSLCQMRHVSKISQKQKELNLPKVKCFISVNLGKEPQKDGLFLEDVPSFYEEVCKRFSDHVQILGLMAIPPQWMAEKAEPNPLCYEIAELSRRIGEGKLSLGMSQDYLQAIKAGSSYVRIGSNIFGPRT